MSDQPSARQQVAMVGPGSVGLFFAAHLAAAGHDVVACARRPFDRYLVESETHPVDTEATVLTDPAAYNGGPLPWVFVAVKAHQTEGAAGWLDRLCGPETRVVVAQNGIEHDRVVPFVNGATVIPAVVYCGAELVEPGHVTHHQSAHLVVADGPDADALVELFADALPEIRPTDDFATPLWMKLSLNVMANGLTALTRRAQKVFAEPGIERAAIRLLHETFAVGRAEGADLDNSLAEKIVAGVVKRGVPGTSMYYDTSAGRPTEHDAIHGAALRAAERHGIDTPSIALVHALLDARAPIANA